MPHLACETIICIVYMSVTLFCAYAKHDAILRMGNPELCCAAARMRARASSAVHHYCARHSLRIMRMPSINILYSRILSIVGKRERSGTRVMMAFTGEMVNISISVSREKSLKREKSNERHTFGC